MKIAHFGPFAPWLAGIYEAARDMVKADIGQGHDAVFVDVGKTKKDGVHQPPQVGAIDDRAGFPLQTVSFEAALDTDVLVMHQSAPDNWLVRTSSPIIWMLHGRPLASFRPEQKGVPGNTYTHTRELANWPRVRRMVTLWPEHVPFWQVLVPEEKLVCIGPPPVDRDRFSPDGPRHDFGGRAGKWNILIADTWRDDVDIFEVAHAPLLLAERRPGLKVHFCAVEQPFGPWNSIFDAYDRLGIKGHLYERVANIDQLYRASDLLLTPHRIATRTMAECLSCGTPVVAAEPCSHTRYSGIPEAPETMAAAIAHALDAGDVARAAALEAADAFGLEAFGQKMNAVYERALAGEPSPTGARSGSASLPDPPG
ncbi:MAG: hypothetical protein ABIF82_01610, partial [Planctomycetota bacterium]